MFKEYYSINEVFISKYGIYKDGRFEFIWPYTYHIIIKSGNRYKSIIPEEKGKYSQFEKCSEEEKENSILWGRIDSVYPYLNKEEIEVGKISIMRLNEISDIVNGAIYIPEPPKVGNILRFRARKQ